MNASRSSFRLRALSVWVSLFFLTVAWSGCIGSGEVADSPEYSPGGASPQAGTSGEANGTGGTASGDRGAIDGLVVSEEELPVEGALVNLSGGPEAVNASAYSNATGSYRFEDLAPGNYSLSVVAQNYSQANTSVDVVAGEAAALKTVLVTAGLRVGPLLYTYTDTFTGDLLFGNPQGTTTECPNPDLSCVDIPVPIVGTSPEGVPVIAMAARVTLETTEGGASMTLAWRKGGTNLASDTAVDDIGGTRSIDYRLAMEPGDDYSIRVREIFGGPTTYIVDIEVDYHSR